MSNLYLRIGQIKRTNFNNLETNVDIGKLHIRSEEIYKYERDVNVNEYLVRIVIYNHGHIVYILIIYTGMYLCIKMYI